MKKVNSRAIFLIWTHSAGNRRCDGAIMFYGSSGYVSRTGILRTVATEHESRTFSRWTVFWQNHSPVFGEYCSAVRCIHSNEFYWMPARSELDIRWRYSDGDPSKKPQQWSRQGLAVQALRSGQFTRRMNHNFQIKTLKSGQMKKLWTRIWKLKHDMYSNGLDVHSHAAFGLPLP